VLPEDLAKDIAQDMAKETVHKKAIEAARNLH